MAVILLRRPAMRLFAVRPLLPVWLLLLGWVPTAKAQTAASDSLRRVLARTPPDSSRVLLLLKLAYTYRASRPDSTRQLAQRALGLAQRLGFGKGEGRALGLLGSAERERGELPAAFAYQLRARQLSRRHHDAEGEAYCLNALGNISLDLRQYRQALRYYEASMGLYERLHRPEWVAGALTNLGSCYERLNVLDSALLRQRQAEALIAQHPRPRLAAALALRNMGTVQARLGNFAAALAYYRRALRETAGTNDLRNRAMAQYHLANLYQGLHQPDSSLHYAHRALGTAQAVAYRVTTLEASTLLARLHRARRNVDSAFYYQAVAETAHDNLFGPEKFRQLQLLALADQERALQVRDAQARQAARTQRLGLGVALFVFLLVAVLLGHANRQQRRANRLLTARNAQIEAQRRELDHALSGLHAAQAQLVAAEKWAFVGEVSAGIAHELQNPLAFMQNFAAVSEALLDQGQAGAAPAGLAHEILVGLKQNLREISQHGLRASSIIRDMLAHARDGAGPRVPTDLNALVSEYLRLANDDAPGPAAVAWHAELAPGLAPVAVVPTELGRALLNLFVNARQAVRRRQAGAEAGYKPRVIVRTRAVGDAVEIRVRDNGPGMPAAVAAQVFRPFFTTNAAGEGTGLGLSLAHDIVVKSHGGTLTVETREGEFTEFTVRIPA